MNKEEIEKRIEDLERAEFLLQMKDHWSAEDFSRSNQYNSRIRELKAQLKEMK